MSKTGTGPCWMAQTKGGFCPAVDTVKLWMMMMDIE